MGFDDEFETIKYLFLDFQIVFGFRSALKDWTFFLLLSF